MDIVTRLRLCSRLRVARHSGKLVGALRRPSEAGVTLIEMLLVVLLISLMIGVTVPAFQAGLPTIRLRSASSSVAQFLRAATMQVERNQSAVLVRIDPAGKRMEYRSANGDASGEFELPDGVEIVAIYPQALNAPLGAREFLFYPTGSPPPIGVELRNERGSSKSIRLNPITLLPLIEDANTPRGEQAPNR